jgi:hypothetical protein
MARDRNYWFQYDYELVAGDDEAFTLTFSTGGIAEDISGWTFTYYADADWNSTETISVADAAMTKSDSGTGVTDTLSIPITDTQSDITKGKYDHSLTALVPTDKRSIFRGTLRILEKQVT